MQIICKMTLPFYLQHIVMIWFSIPLLNDIEIKWIMLLQYCLLLAKLYSNIYVSCLLTLRYFLELDQKCQFELLKSKHIALRSLLTLKKEKNDFGDNYIEFLESYFFSPIQEDFVLSIDFCYYVICFITWLPWIP